MESSAFSLVELMVVIAIVAILAAVAVPQYKGYLLSARMAKTLAQFAPVLQRAEAYQATHAGGFPQGPDIGYPSDINGAVADPSVFGNQDLQAAESVWIQGNSSINGGACNDESIISLFAPDYYIYLYSFKINGTYTRVCVYSYCTDDTCTNYGEGNVLPGCTNLVNGLDPTEMVYLPQASCD